MSRRIGKDAQVRLRRDENFQTYSLDQDARGDTERVRYVRLDLVHPSRFQVRLVFRPERIRELADDIQANGLIHPPVARPHPEKPGEFELAPGEMRLRALRELAKRDAQPEPRVFKRDADGNRLIPVLVREFNDVEARAMVFSENDQRTDLSEWERALAIASTQRLFEEWGKPATTRALQEETGTNKSTVGEYLRIARIDVAVFEKAGVTKGGTPDAEALELLSRQALVRIADEEKESVDAAVRRLKNELRYARRRADRKSGPTPAPDPPSPAASRFQINIRTPLGELKPNQARRYLLKMAPAVEVLAERARDELTGGQAREVALQLERVARALSSE